LRLVQITHGDGGVGVENQRYQLKSIPVELLRIFQAVRIQKVGDNLRIEKKILVDAGRISETLH
jgi:hypothetical protein